ncbi:hypothetical protein M5E86_09545 [Blautia wexlerae]|nr:hypothetical protein M5E86_09545 [Blautia wexlerae]
MTQKKTEKASDSDNTDSEATKKPEGEAPDGNGQAPDSQGASDVAGQTEEITLDDIKEGDVVAITLDDDGNAKQPSQSSPWIWEADRVVLAARLPV